MNRLLRQVLTMVLVFVFIISSVVPAYAESTEETTTSPSMVTVTFKMNRGDDTIYQEVQVPAGSSLGDQMPANPYIKDITFVSWSTEKSGWDRTKNFDKTTVVNSDTTVYARWRNDILWYYEVYLQGKDGQYRRWSYGQGGWAVADDTVSIGPEKFEGEKTGWGDVIGKDYTYNAEHPNQWLSATAREADRQHPLRIYFKRDPFTVTYSYDETVPDNVQVPDSQTAWENEKISLPIPTAEDYIFQGWTVKTPEGRNNLINEGTLTMPDTNVELVGSWKKQSSTVTFKMNRGDDTTYQEVKVPTGTTLGDQMPNDPAISDITFVKWTTQKSGGEDFDKDTVVTGDMTVYAQWRDDILWYFEVYLQGKDGQYFRWSYGQGGWATADATVSIGPEKFEGEKTGWGDVVGKDYSYNADHPDQWLSATAREADRQHPLRIYFKRDPFTVTYSYDETAPDNIQVPDSQTAWKNEKITLPAPMADGYIFNGWKVKMPEGRETLINDGVLNMPDTNVELVGSWTRDEPVNPPNPDPIPKPHQHPDKDKPTVLNTEDHFLYIHGYPEDYRNGIQTDNEDLWPVKPEANITRAEVASIFYRLLKEDVRNANTVSVNAFNDVDQKAWYNVTVSTLAKLGIVRGYSDGSFKPDAPITRAEFAALATRFFERQSSVYQDGTFSDVNANDWYADAIAAAVDHKLLGGYPDGTVQPQKNITRAETCAVINRTLGRVPHPEHLLSVEQMKTWPDNPKTMWYYSDVQEASNGHEYQWKEEDGKRFEQWTRVHMEGDWRNR